MKSTRGADDSPRIGAARRLAEVEAVLRDAALTPRGAFHPVPADQVPPLPGGRAVGTIVLAGNAGPAMWHRFAADRADAALTLDQWSMRVLVPIAAALGGHAVFPFDRPYLPFQRWAMRAEACHPSPLGILIHPDYGLWHGYRGALLFAEAFALPAPDNRPSPCLACTNRPCLAMCPVAAFGDGRYDVNACATHLATEPAVECMTLSCAARRACPVGPDFRYEPVQARFHMEAFRRNHRQRSPGSP